MLMAAIIREVPQALARGELSFMPRVPIDVELAVLTRPGAASRQGEVESVGETLKRWRKLARIEEPGTIDGGDVLRIGRDVFVGHSARTNGDGIHQLDRLL